MGKYAPGLTFGQVCTLEKELIKHALNGELAVCESENGFVYGKATKEECDKFILGAYDEVVFIANQEMNSGRAIEAILNKHGLDNVYGEYLEMVAKESGKFDDYVYEVSDDDAK